MKYKAFISYRHTENGQRHAIALETALKRYANPTLSPPMKIFRDEKHLKPGQSLSKVIKDGLNNSEYLIFLAEKASATSQWCGEELEYWCNPEHLNRADRLIIIQIDDDIVLNGTEGFHFDKTTALPSLLQKYLNFIPLYVDLRWAKTDNETNLLHPPYRHKINALAARLRDKTPEDLSDEEIQVFRRNIRLRNGAIGVLMAMLLVSGGAAWWALKQQKIAQKQTELAQQNEQRANQKTLEAERNLTDRIEQETQKERLNFDKHVNNGDVFANSGDFLIALRYYQKADSILHKFPKDLQLLMNKEMLMKKLNNALIKTQPK